MISTGIDRVQRNRGTLTERALTTPLHRAALKGHLPAVRLLTASGADVNARNRNGEAPLHYAAAQGYHAVVTYLLAQGADVNVRTRKDHTPLHETAISGHAALARLLMEHAREHRCTFGRRHHAVTRSGFQRTR